MPGATGIPFIVCAGVGALLNPLPLPKAIASGNVGTSMLIIWTELACLLQFVNAIRWNGNVTDRAPLWCDFCGRFLVAADIALVGTGVSINRHLYMIVTLDPRIRQKKFNALVDFVLCLGIPSLVVVLEYVAQQYRYYIFEDVGCIPGVGNVALAYPLVWMLPLVLGTVLAAYACCIIYANLQRNYRVTAELGPSLPWSRRLSAIAVVSILYGLVPTSMAIVLTAAAHPVMPWPGWKVFHSTIDDVVYVPALEWRSDFTQIVCVELRRWTIVSLAYVVFLLLGLTSGVKSMYWGPFRNIFAHLFSIPNNHAGSLPWQNTDENSNGHWEGSPTLCVPSEETLVERRSSIGLADRSRLETDLESMELTAPPVATYPALCHLGATGGCSAYI